MPAGPTQRLYWKLGAEVVYLELEVLNNTCDYDLFGVPGG